VAREVVVAEPSDERLADFRDLTRADRRPDRPGGRGLVIAEGTVVVRRLLRSRYPVRSLLGVRRRIEELASDLAGVDVPAYITSPDVMAEVVGFHLNRGVLAVAGRAPQASFEDLSASAGVLLGLEGVGDHENLGALFRNAAALGVDGVLLGPGCADPLYRRSVRVSMGHVLHVPFAAVDDLPGAVKALRGGGFRVAALTPRADAMPLPEFAAQAGARVALLLGSEGHGLSEAAIGAADTAVRIPMADDVDSLNVATAGAIACYALVQHGPRVSLDTS
jgi:tRNA G18 (ribose-2'-O)-methylase SpoU